ncbi:hypothetical protein R3P38DRAFT_3016461 [Favolaschia claudopus]|uniref:Uncharacterized protein n=1 Tax=Favolaschia claudopus TaxID=2862362 RepID=A0AAW0AIR8_9AGAR
MSARTPFVPGGFTSSSRPESRAAQSANVATQSSGTPPHFVADPSNPLNGGPLVPTSSKDHAENRPLNINSLTRSNRTNNSNQTHRRQSIQSSAPKSMPAPPQIMRPGTSDPHLASKSHPNINHRLQAHANSHSIAAPTPLQAARSTPALFSGSNSSFAQSTFKTPALPVSRLSPQQKPLSPTRTTGDVHNDNNNAFRLKSLPSQPGPHRIVFGAPADPTDDDEIYEIVDPQVRSASGGGRNKRGRSELDDDNEKRTPARAYAKRFKAQADPRASNAANDMYYRSQDYPPPVQQQQHQPQQQSRRQQLPNRPNINDLDHRFSPQITNNPAGSELAALFRSRPHHADPQGGRIRPRVRSADRKVCTLGREVEDMLGEEWIAGADELSELYSKIFDYVKSHMTFVPLTLPLSLFSFSHRSNSVKVKLFANCDEKLKEHGEVLKDRDGLLADVKDRLVAESGNVLGSGD